MSINVISNMIEAVNNKYYSNYSTKHLTNRSKTTNSVLADLSFFEKESLNLYKKLSSIIGSKFGYSWEKFTEFLNSQEKIAVNDE